MSVVRLFSFDVLARLTVLLFTYQVGFQSAFHDNASTDNRVDFDPILYNPLETCTVRPLL
jgi:hypothetical protein